MALGYSGVAVVKHPTFNFNDSEFEYPPTPLLLGNKVIIK